MSQQPARHPVTLKHVLYEMPGMENVTIRKGVVYAPPDGDVRTMDVYYPPDLHDGELRPAVIFVMGFSDVGAQAVFGCRTNEMESNVSWGRLVAASGVIGVTYTTGIDPAADVRELFAFLDVQGASIGVDAARIALWACSGHVPNALGALIDRQQPVKCGVLCYGFMLDLDGATGVAEGQRGWKFANPGAGRTIDDFPADVPLFVARAGRDEIPHVNESIDRFVAHAVRRNLPLTFVNHHAAPHAFDLVDDSATTRRIVASILTFLGRELRGIPVDFPS